MKPIVYFRVNAEKDKGLGHWVRCTALAEMLSSKFDCIFLIQTQNKAIIELTQAQGYACHHLPHSNNLLEELVFLERYFLRGNEILVLDSYVFTTSYQQAVKDKVGKLVCIDDIHQTHFVADVVINHSGGIQASDYSSEPMTQLCLGLDYLLLRKTFFRKRSSAHNRNADFDKILICMGGEDPNNDSLKILKQCEQKSDINSCEVIIGISYAHKDELAKFVKQSSLVIKVSHQLSAEELHQKMQSCTVAICPPSTIALEYLSVSGNLFLHQTANNQKFLNQYLLDNKLAFPFAQWLEVDAQQLSQARERQRLLVDGKSPERLLSLFEALQLKIDLCFRLARPEEVKKYFDWANDQATRQQSFQSEPIAFSQHEIWFNHQLVNKDAVLLLMESYGEAFGQVRFKLTGDKATISYSLDKKARGKGLAKHLIIGGIAYLQNNHPRITSIEGFVKLDNHPSIKTFRRIGFQEQNIESPIRQLKYSRQIKPTS